MEENYFEILNSVNVADKTEKKNGLTYLSWAWAWAEFKKVCPNATYNVLKFENDLPYVYDENNGYMVFTTVTVGDLMHEMWLPVMDGANKAMKKDQYKYLDKWNKEKTVAATNMFDINKTIMRCLTKNLAMFGLGLYIYAGEDLPEADQPEGDKETPTNGKNTNTKKPDVKKSDVKKDLDTEDFPKDMTGKSKGSATDKMLELKNLRSETASLAKLKAKVSEEVKEIVKTIIAKYNANGDPTKIEDIKELEKLLAELKNIK